MSVAGSADLRFPFKAGMRVIELGGGATPRFHPNADVRWLPQVEIVCDFNYPLPIPSGQYDGLYCSYALEHLSWRHVHGFLSECHRILRPGGIAVFITANLWEQCRVLTHASDWDENLICMLFGDQNYAANTHRCGFSPEYATKVLKDIGFYEIAIYPHPQAVTDMIVQAHKSQAEVHDGK